MADAEDRTEAASERRLEKAREEGNVPVSREVSMFASLAAGMATAWMMAGDGTSTARWLGRSLRMQGGSFASVERGAALDLLYASLPVWFAAAGAFAAATLLQTSFLLHMGALKPDLSRLSPLRGLKRMVGVEAVSNMLKALAKLIVLAACMAIAMRGLARGLALAPHWHPEMLLKQISAHAAGLLLLLLGAHAAIAGGDLLWVRAQHARRMRMSRQELRDEHKESDGNPQVKQRLRQVARSRARHRMMASVPKAAVVVTNPSHYAVALAYERGSKGAPRIVAKGADEVAARIRELAREANVPLVANPPLARALYRFDIDTEIPAEHFKAVAEIIAFIWRMRTRPGRL